MKNLINFNISETKLKDSQKLPEKIVLDQDYLNNEQANWQHKQNQDSEDYFYLFKFLSASQYNIFLYNQIKDDRICPVCQINFKPFLTLDECDTFIEREQTLSGICSSDCFKSLLETNQDATLLLQAIRKKNTGNVFLSQKKYKQAIRSLLESAEFLKHPALHQCSKIIYSLICSVAKSYLALQDYSKVIQYCDHAKSIHSGLAPAWYTSSLCQLELHNYFIAHRDIQKASQLLHGQDDVSLQEDLGFINAINNSFQLVECFKNDGIPSLNIRKLFSLENRTKYELLENLWHEGFLSLEDFFLFQFSRDSINSGVALFAVHQLDFSVQISNDDNKNNFEQCNDYQQYKVKYTEHATQLQKYLEFGYFSNLGQQFYFYSLEKKQEFLSKLDNFYNIGFQLMNFKSPVIFDLQETYNVYKKIKNQEVNNIDQQILLPQQQIQQDTTNVQQVNEETLNQQQEEIQLIINKEKQNEEEEQK